MQVILAALGGGTPETLTTEAKNALEKADCVIGARRLLDGLCDLVHCELVAATRATDIMAAIEARPEAKTIVAAYSGDTGFYSGARSLVPLLKEKQIPYRVLPGVSSVQLLAARLGRPWQDWTLVSAHGAQCDPVAAVCGGRPAFFLTGSGDGTPQALCAALVRAGLGSLRVTIGENLSCREEKITECTAAQAAEQSFAPLSVLLAEAAPCVQPRTVGWPDEAFTRDRVPMTKQEVRAAALAKLGIRPGETAWDVGAGTGSVAIELTLAGARTYAVECEEAACELIKTNREKFGAWGLRLIQGHAPCALAGLPAPDAAFIGGSKGELEGIVRTVLAANPNARICISAIAVETLGRAVASLTENGIEANVTQIAVARTKNVAGLHMMQANNPVWLITGNCE